MKSNLLYIGNKLSGSENTLTSIETLGFLLEKEGYTLYYASSKKNKLLRLSEMLVKTFQYRNKVDYVLIDTYSTLNFWYAFLVSQWCRILKIKYIPKLHGGNLPNRLKKNPVLCQLIFKYAYKNIAPSDYLLEAFKNRGYAELVYIPNTIEIANYPFKLRSNSFPKLLWVRSLSSIYNPQMALKVTYELKKHYPNVDLCMVGPDKDNLLPKLEDLTKHLDVNVIFTGKLSKKEWIKLSENYTIFINTTHFDNTPVSVIEAMALGLPVVSTNVGGIPYLLNNNQTALLVDDDDVFGMVTAIKQIVEDEKLNNNIVKNALELVQQFDWKLVKRRWDEILVKP